MTQAGTPLLVIECGTAQVDIEAGGLRTIRICPDGKVASKNGSFIIDDEAFRLMLEDFTGHGVEVPIDFEHATLGKQYAPAAGWVTRIWHDKGRGLFALVRWNDRAREARWARRLRTS